MRRRPALAPVLALVAGLAGCSSSGRLGEMRSYPQPQDVVWQAANQAMVDLGAAIVSTSPAMGVVVGRLQLVEAGMPITVEASVRGSSRDPSAAQTSGADVRVSAFPPRDTAPDDDLTAALEELEERYLELLHAAVARMLEMGRPPRSFPQ
jgi:hypothetical protein